MQNIRMVRLVVAWGEFVDRTFVGLPVNLLLSPCISFFAGPFSPLLFGLPVS